MSDTPAAPEGLMPCPSRPWNVEVKETDHGPLYVVYGSDGRLVGSDTNKEQMKLIVDAVNGYAAPIPSGEPPTEALAVAKRVIDNNAKRGDCIALAAEQRAESLQAQSDNFKAVAINYIDRFEHTEAKLATLSQHAEAMAVWIENEAVWIENDPAAFAEIVEAHPQYRKAFPKPNPEATLCQQIDDAKLYQTIKSQIERREFQYRVEESADGFEPQMLYTLGRLDGFAWFPLTANGYWADPDAFTDGEIKIRSVFQTKEDAERAIVCAKRINGEKLISAVSPDRPPQVAELIAQAKEAAEFVENHRDIPIWLASTFDRLATALAAQGDRE